MGFGFFVLEELGCTVVAVGSLTIDVEKVGEKLGSRINPADGVADALVLDEEVVSVTAAEVGLVFIELAAWAVVDVGVVGMFLGHSA